MKRKSQVSFLDALVILRFGQWRTTPPPDGIWVQVRTDDEILRARAIYDDGDAPYWEDEDGERYDADAFAAWRHIIPKESVIEYDD